MKKLVIMFILATSPFSFNASALEVVDAIGVAYGSAAVSYTLVMISMGKDLGDYDKEAVQVLEDSQDYFQSGNISAFLAVKINEIRNENESLSELEAVDELTARATQIIK